MVKVADLPVKFEHNRPLVQVKVNGEAAWLLIDTGSSTTVLFGPIATRLRLPIYRSSFYMCSMYGCGELERTDINTLDLAGVTIPHVKMDVVGGGAKAGFDGLLGRDILHHYDIEFDLAGRMVRLWNAQGCEESSLAYWTARPGGAPLREDRDGAYRVKIAVNGKAVEATLDSGAYYTAMVPGLAEDAGVQKEDYRKIILEQRTDIEVKPMKVANLQIFVIGTEQIKNTRIAVEEMRHDTWTVTTPVLLGADFLRSHRVLIAPDQHLVYFTYSGGPVFEVVGDPVVPAATSSAVGPASVATSVPVAAKTP